MNTRALRRTSLQLRLALTVAVASSVLCIIAGALAYRIGSERARSSSHSVLDGLSSAVERTVAEGAYVRDPVLLGEIARGLARNDLVAEVEIRSETGVLLAHQGDAATAAVRTTWFVQRRLASPFSTKVSVGTMRIWANESRIAAIASQDALQLASLMMGLVVLIGLLLYEAAARLVSRPVVALVRQLESMLPGTDRRLALPREHREDEIGVLIHGMNAMLEATETALSRERAMRSDIELVVEHRTAELRIAKEHAESASRAKTQFLATMSHEIRTPLNGVLGMNELLMRSNLHAGQREWAEAVQSSGQHLLSVINDILDFSKIEAGQMEFESLDFSLVGLVEETLTMFAHPAQSKGLELAAQFMPNEQALADLCGDPFRLRQVLANLIANAIKFTERGEVVIRVTLAEHSTTETDVTICVADTGIGIPAEALGTIFEAFSQADGSTTRRYGGSGLGLAICRRLVTLMGGRIAIESTPGQGSQFSVELRLPRARDTPSRRPECAALKGVRVLAVDDNRTNREILRVQLEGYGAVPTCVAGGAEALTVLRQGTSGRAPFDLIVLDMHMPEMDGLQLAAALREMRELPAMPILLLTPASTSAGAREREALGIRRCLNKPVRRTDFLKALRSLASSETLSMAAPPAPESEESIRLTGTVLLVEDNIINQRVAAAMLAALGLESTLADNGRVAVDLAQARDFDLVLMDCQMPVMDGYEATARIRALAGDRAKVPVVALTANALRGDEQKCLAAGMDSFLAKPFTLSQLAATLGRWLPRAAQEHPVADRPLPDSGSAANGLALASSIDMKQIATLRQLGAKAGTDLVADLLRDFVAHSDECIERLESALASNDAQQIARAAHAMKSSTANLGAVTLSDLYRRMELFGRERRVNDARALLAELRTAQDCVVARACELLEEAA